MGSIRVAVVGSEGRMGRFTRDLLAGEEARGLGLELALCIGSGDDLGARLAAEPVAVAVDFTRAGLGLEHGLALLAAGVRPVIGTSGVDAAQTRELDARARELDLGGIVVPNFSLGIWLQQKLALEAARHLRAVELIEEHAATKRDAPSGTAVDTVERLAAAGHGAAVPIHSVRLPGLYSNQTVLFGGPGEVLRLTHETYGLEAFGPGILASLTFATRALGVPRGLGAALDDGARESGRAGSPGRG